MKSLVDLTGKALFVDTGFGQSEAAREYRWIRGVSTAVFIASAASIFPFIIFGIISAWFLFASIPLTVLSLICLGLNSEENYEDRNIKNEIIRVLDDEASKLFNGDMESTSPDIYSALRVTENIKNTEFSLDAISSSQVDWIEKKWQKFSDKHSAYALKKENREAHDRLSQLGNDKETNRINHQIQATKELHKTEETV